MIHKVCFHLVKSMVVHVSKMDRDPFNYKVLVFCDKHNHLDLQYLLVPLSTLSIVKRMQYGLR